MEDLAKRLVKIVPTKRQLIWHKLEFYAFIHFGINTFYEREWGNGKEDPKMFNPTDINCEQWILSLKQAHIKAVILTCKHHDGFCLWPSKYTEHSLKNSPYKNGKGDIVKEVSDACIKYGLKFGIYLSPWDMNSEFYGTGEKYNEFFKNQLTELLTEYGEIFTIWFDGACGEGKNGKKQIYDWEMYYDTIRDIQPDACISICGPDVRWCGNEAGQGREKEWNVVSKRLSIAEIVANNSQKEDNKNFREREISSSDLDLGSREILKYEKDLIWYPCEVDTSIRQGWFYHKDEQPKALDKLISIYYNSVGANASLLLNVPPNKKGLIDEKDQEVLKKLGNYLEQTFKNCITHKAKITADIEEAGKDVQFIKFDDEKFYKGIDGNEKCEITLNFNEKNTIHHIVLKEEISLSQRIEEFEIWAEIERNLIKIYNGFVIGSKKICKLEPIYTDTLILKINKSRVCPTLNFFGVYI